MFDNAAAFLQYLHEHDVRFVNLWFSNLYGGWHRIGVPAGRVDAAFLARGEGFDGSSIPGFTRLDQVFQGLL